MKQAVLKQTDTVSGSLPGSINVAVDVLKSFSPVLS